MKLDVTLKSLYTFIFIVLCHIVIEISNSDDQEVDRVSIVVTLVVLLFLSAGLLFILKRVKEINYNRLMLSYIFLINVVANIEKSFTLNTQRQELVFKSVLLLTFVMRLNSFFTVSLIAVASSCCYCSLSYGDLLYRGSSTIDALSWWDKVEQFYRILNLAAYLLVLVLYAYWDEATRKISFVINFRKLKEFQKAKRILNILVPGIVRAQI